MRRWTAVAFASAVYALAWVGWVQGWPWLVAFDTWGLRVLHAGSSAWTHAVDVYCTVLSPSVFRIAGLVVIAWLMARRRWRPAVFLLLTVEGSAVLTELAKWLADRPRPATALVPAYGTSFPSGHALGLMVIILTAWVLLLPRASGFWRGFLIAVGVWLVLSIGIARVVLNVHNPSDVIAGWALGYLYFVLCCGFMSEAGKPAALGTGSARLGRGRRQSRLAT